jgi:hypothetical protein
VSPWRSPPVERFVADLPPKLEALEASYSAGHMN